MLFLVIGLVLYPAGWGSDRVKDLCSSKGSEKPGAFVMNSCSFGWAFYAALGGTILTCLCSLLSAQAEKSTSSDKVQDEIHDGKVLICLIWVAAVAIDTVEIGIYFTLLVSVLRHDHANSVIVETKFHLECKLCFPRVEVMVQQMHWTTVSFEACNNCRLKMEVDWTEEKRISTVSSLSWASFSLLKYSTVCGGSPWQNTFYPFSGAILYSTQ